MFSDPFSILVALVVVLCIAVVGILVAINQSNKRRALHAQQSTLLVEPPPRWYSLLIILTETKLDRTVSIKGYGLFSYRDPDLFEGLDPIRTLASASSDSSVTSPLMSIVSHAIRNKTYQFFERRPDLNPDDEIPVCLPHNRVLVFRDGVIAPCPDTFGARIRSGNLQEYKHKTRPLAQNSPFFPLRQALISEKRWDILQ
ncbi:MAG TPA: hypothetical protein VLG12_00745 [Candidatus Saccharimonadales bacterium]|nr:hypothetical protein [Candidatus Saccharimonadales bacterium]